MCDDITDITLTLLSEHTLDQLRAADRIVDDVLTAYPAQCARIAQVGTRAHVADISLSVQMPVVLVPVHLRRPHIEHTMTPSCQRAVCLRPFITNDFMTGRAAMPGKDLPEQVRACGMYAWRVCAGARRDGHKRTGQRRRHIGRTVRLDIQTTWYYRMGIACLDHVVFVVIVNAVRA